MKRLRLISGVLCLAVWASGCAVQQPSPGLRRSSTVISTPEIAELSASNAYEIVQRLHPDWLRARPHGNLRAGDPVIAVFVNGSRYGTVESLSQVSADLIGSIEYLDQNRVQQEFTRISGEAVVAAILISTRDRMPELTRVAERTTASRIIRKTGWVITGYMYPSSHSSSRLAESIEQDMREAGWSAGGQQRQYPTSSGSDANWMVSIHRTLRPPFGVELLYGSVPQGTTSGYRPNTLSILNLSHSAQFLSGLAFYEWGYLRTGVGPALLHSDWEWHDTPISAAYPLEDHAWKESSLGVLSNIAVTLPILEHFFGEIQAQGRFFPESEIPEYNGLPASQVDPSGWFVGVGFGVHF